MAKKNIEPQIPLKKGGLSACVINAELLQELWDELHKDGDFVWIGVVGTGGDLLGKEDERPYQEVSSWQELGELLQSIPRIDRFNLTVEIPDKGTVGIKFKNYTSPTGALLVTGPDQAWTEEKFKAVKAIFEARRQDFEALLFSWIGFGVVQSAIPLSVSFIVVMLLAGLLIPYEIRHSHWVWWITAFTVVVTLRSAYTISNQLIIYTLKRYSYIQWRS